MATIFVVTVLSQACERPGASERTAVKPTAPKPAVLKPAPAAVEQPYAIGVVASKPASGNTAEPISGNALPGYQSRDYWFIANNHKRPKRGGPTAGWNLAIRKQDGCLLVISSHSNGCGSETVTEISVKQSRRFERDVSRVAEKLTRRYPDLDADKIVREMGDCPLGYRPLVDRESSSEGPKPGKLQIPTAQ